MDFSVVEVCGWRWRKGGEVGVLGGRRYSGERGEVRGLVYYSCIWWVVMVWSLF